MRRYGLRDDQWNRIKDLLPGREGTVGVTAKDNRLFVEAVLYRYRAGIAWRDLPERFGDFRVIHTRHTRWNKTRVWKRIFEHLAEDTDNRLLSKLRNLVKFAANNWRGPEFTAVNEDRSQAFNNEID